MENCCTVEGCLTPAKARGLCDMHYYRWRKYGTTTLPVAPRYDQCRVERCDRTPRSLHASLCEMHYYRLRRNGSTELDPTSPSPNNPARPKFVPYRVQGRGYIRLMNADHPLAHPDRSVFEHRAVAYDARNGEPPDCEWCGVAMEWDSAVVDHIDNDPANNSPANLLVACHQCNSSRGMTGPRRFAEAVAVRVLCRLYAEQRATIVGEVMELWRRVGGVSAMEDNMSPRVTVKVFASDAQPKGPRGHVSDPNGREPSMSEKEPTQVNVDEQTNVNVEEQTNVEEQNVTVEGDDKPREADEQ